MGSRLNCLLLIFAAVYLCPQAFGQTTPALIVKDELPRFAKWLDLSDAQALQMHSLHDAYVVNWEATYGKELAEFDAIRNEARMGTLSRPDLHGGESILASATLALDLADKLRPRLDGANESFYAQLSGILSDQQASKMQRVRLGHDRRRTYKRSFISIREINIDPFDMVERLNLSPDESARVANLTLEVEPPFVSALRAVSEGLDRGFRSQAIAAEWLRVKDEGDNAHAIRSFAAWQHKATAESFGESKRLVEVIRNALKQFSEVVGSPGTELEFAL